jgi:hypothetical protein
VIAVVSQKVHREIVLSFGKERKKKEEGIDGESFSVRKRLFSNSAGILLAPLNVKEGKSAGCEML